jgi:hypothetical protein
MQLQLKTILNAVQHFPGFVFHDVRLERYRDGQPRHIEIVVKPHAGIPARCSRCHRPAPGYDQLEQRSWLFVPLCGLVTWFIYTARRPAWDQLANGSLDTRYIEAQGIVTATEPEILDLLTHSGSVEVHLTDVDPAFAGTNQNNLKQYQNDLIRVRGCVIPGRDDTTEQIQMGYFWLCSYSISVDPTAPADPFFAPLKSGADLRRFDSHASILQRVRVDGQIPHQQGNEFFLWDGANGLRFILRTPVHLSAGDMVGVVGFPDLRDGSPILREALLRVAGHAALPPPTFLSDALLLKERFDRRLTAASRLGFG